MLRQQFQFFRVLNQVLDGLWVLVAWSLAYFLRFGPTQEVPFSEYLKITPFLLFTWYLSLQLAGAYKNWGGLRLGSEIFAVLRGSVFAFLLLIAGVQFFAREEFSRIVLASSFALTTLLLILSRWGFSFFLATLRRRGYGRKNLLLIGSPELTDRIQKRVQGRWDFGLTVVGTMEYIPERVGELSRWIEENSVHVVMISLRNDQASGYDALLAEMVLCNVEVRIIPDLSQFAILGFEVESFQGLPLLTLNQSPMVGWNSVLKRASDIVYSTALLLVFSPLMIAIALLVKLTSRGPVLYGQERMGMDGRSFTMWKFRSMSLDAEKETGAVWARKDDDRTTWVGKILRRTSLDELPQFFNVLMGEMSCVGPRPERPVFVEKFKKEIPGYMLRHKVKAGITGWAQVNGLRGNTSLEDRIEYDLYYITHWSLAFDFRIMLMTVFKGFVHSNAY